MAALALWETSSTLRNEAAAPTGSGATALTGPQDKEINVRHLKVKPDVCGGNPIPHGDPHEAFLYNKEEVKLFKFRNNSEKKNEVYTPPPPTHTHHNIQALLEFIHIHKC